MRGFQIIKKELIDKTINYDLLKLPTRSTAHSAGYDFYSGIDVVIKPHEKVIIPTFIKAYMESDEFLGIYIRSSMAIKKGLNLANNTAIIDSDYYENPDNDGHIMLSIVNNSEIEHHIAFGDKIAQGIFQKYLLADNDEVLTKRTSGIGSTGK